MRGVPVRAKVVRRRKLLPGGVKRRAAMSVWPLLEQADARCADRLRCLSRGLGVLNRIDGANPLCAWHVYSN